MFNFNHLYYFYQTAKYASVTLASRQLKISQPSLSMQLKSFEHALGKNLFAKRGRSLELTPDGLKAYGFCRKIFELADELWDEMSGQPDARSSRLRIGITPDIERPFISEILSDIVKHKPARALPLLALETVPQREARHALASRQIDALINSAPVHGEPVTILSSVSLPVNLVISRRLLGKHFPGKATVKRLLRDLPGGLILPSISNPLRFEIDSFLLRQSCARAVVLESDMLAIVGRAILNGVGFGFFPAPYLNREIRAKRVRVFGPKSGFWQYRIFLSGAPQLKSEPVIRELRAALERLAKLQT